MDVLFCVSFWKLPSLTTVWSEDCSVIVDSCYVLQYFFEKSGNVSSSLWGYLTEWLRWWTRNPLGNSRVGSNPAVVGLTSPFLPEWHYAGQPSWGQTVYVYEVLHLALQIHFKNILLCHSLPLRKHILYIKNFKLLWDDRSGHRLTESEYDIFTSVFDRLLFM